LTAPVTADDTPTPLAEPVHDACIQHAIVCTVRSAKPAKPRTTDLQIRGIPVKSRDALRRKAESKGLSMSQYLIDLIQHDVATMPLEKWIALVRKDPPVDLGGPAATVVREVRDERDAHWDAHFGADPPPVR